MKTCAAHNTSVGRTNVRLVLNLRVTSIEVGTPRVIVDCQGVLSSTLFNIGSRIGLSKFEQFEKFILIFQFFYRQSAEKVPNSGSNRARAHIFGHGNRRSGTKFHLSGFRVPCADPPAYDIQPSVFVHLRPKRLLSRATQQYLSVVKWFLYLDAKFRSSRTSPWDYQPKHLTIWAQCTKNWRHVALG